jgi:hypothetical protein
MREFEGYYPVSARTWPNKPFAFISFASISDAATARRNLTGKLFGMGDKIKVNYNIMRSYVPPIQAALERNAHRRSLSPAPRHRSPSPPPRSRRSPLSPYSPQPSPERDSKSPIPDKYERERQDHKRDRELEQEREQAIEKDRDTEVKPETKSPHKPDVEKRKQPEHSVEPSKKLKVEPETQDILPVSPVSPPSSPSATPSVWSGSLAKGDIVICKSIAFPFGGPALSTIAYVFFIAHTSSLCHHQNPPPSKCYTTNLYWIILLNLLVHFTYFCRPDGLPNVLNVKNRAALDSIGSYINVQQATILKFTPENESDKRPFNDFIVYLKSKNRVHSVLATTC